MLRVCAYCRVSTEKEQQLHSLEAQKSFFKDYIEKNPNWRFTKLYVDEGITGTSTKKRKGFNQMIRDADNKEFDLLITKEISRFARNTLDSIYYTRKLKAQGVGVYFMNDNINTLDVDGELRLTLMSVLAQEESRKLSDRTRWGQQQSMKKGVVFGASMFGYHLHKGKLTINPEEAQTVKLIYDLYLHERMGSCSIKYELENRGIPSPYSNKNWQELTILRILKNSKYMGELTQRKMITTDFLTHEKVKNDDPDELITVENNHEAIISIEQFEAVQREIKRRSTIIENKSHFSNRYCWSCKIVCLECGANFKRKVVNRNSKNPQTIWSCTNYNKYGRQRMNAQGDKVGCNSKSIREEILEQAFLQVLKQVFTDREQIAKELQSVLKQAMKQVNKDLETLENLKGEVKQMETKKRKLIELFVTEAIDRKQYDQLSDSYTAESEKLSKQIEELEEKNDRKKALDERIKAVSEAINKIVLLDTFSSEICVNTLEKVEVKQRESLTFYLKFGDNSDPILYPLALRKCPFV